ncbi:MBL fold metallo-hydrolase [Deinococcus ruber]|uniref:MBL fold hydrolase n=1 Tax=Deinococcus ruber TaxID=1848197 RepID=A0A918FAH1_9DEIO|nr:MBL fold metallo-hydrolase [Deinococcus ruber]GGR24637.1 MBL fold hydrolase [Deinococcus ruber]
MTSEPRSTVQGAQEAPRLTQVEGSLYALQVPIPYPMGFVTVLIDTAAPVTLIDTALDTLEARAAIEDALAALNLRWEDVQRVIITHHHPDHYGLAGMIEARSGAQVYMLDIDIARGEQYWHRWDEWLPGHARHFLEHGVPPEAMAGHAAESRRTRERIQPAQHVLPLHEGDTLALAGHTWEVLWLPGHADGHLGLWQPDLSLLIAGDAILPRISPNVGLYAYSRPDPLGDYLGTLARLEALNPARAVVGHHGPVMDAVAERARTLTAHHHERLELVTRTLGEQAMNAYQLSFVMFPRELSESSRRFAVAETLAHAEYLRLHGGLGRRWDGSSWVYFRS